MKSAFPLVTTKQFLQETPKWLEAIRRKENVALLFFPKTDRARRIPQLLEDKAFLRHHLAKNTRYIFQIVDFDEHEVEDKRDLHEHLAKHLNLSGLARTRWRFEQWMLYCKNNNFYIVLIILQAEKYVSEHGQMVFSLLSNMVDDYYPYISIISVYEQDVTHPTQISIVSTSTRLCQNIFFYPLYSSDDALIFIRYLQKKWQITITRKEVEKILAGCGGHFWLLKEAMREEASGGSISLSGQSMRFRLDVIFRSLSPFEQQALKKIITHKKTFSSDEKHSLIYLQKMRCIDKNRNCSIGIYEDFLLHFDDVGSKLHLENSRIVLNGIPLEKFFSRKEYRAMKLLLEKRGTMVSRDEIAKSMWPTQTEAQYSDWAIDQLVARLRKRIAELSISPRVVEVVRGKGYLLKT